MPDPLPLAPQAALKGKTPPQFSMRILLKTKPFEAFIPLWKRRQENAGFGSPTMGRIWVAGNVNWVE